MARLKPCPDEKNATRLARVKLRNTFASLSARRCRFARLLKPELKFRPPKMPLRAFFTTTQPFQAGLTSAAPTALLIPLVAAPKTRAKRLPSGRLCFLQLAKRTCCADSPAQAFGGGTKVPIAIAAL